MSWHKKIEFCANLATQFEASHFPGFNPNGHALVQPMLPSMFDFEASELFGHNVKEAMAVSWRFRKPHQYGLWDSHQSPLKPSIVTGSCQSM